MGYIELTWEKLESWSRLTGVKLLAWEYRLLMTLSSTYTQLSREYNNENVPAPYKGSTETTSLSDNIKSILRTPVEGKKRNGLRQHIYKGRLKSSKKSK